MEWWSPSFRCLPCTPKSFVFPVPGVAVVRGLLSWCVVMLLTMVEGSRCKCPQEWLASMLAYKSGNSLAGNNKCILFFLLLSSSSWSSSSALAWCDDDDGNDDDGEYKRFYWRRQLHYWNGQEELLTSCPDCAIVWNVLPLWSHTMRSITVFW